MIFHQMTHRKNMINTIVMNLIILMDTAWADSLKVKYKRERKVIYMNSFAHNIDVANKEDVTIKDLFDLFE